MKLLVPAGLLERIRGHGESAYPEECCGLLIGHDRSDHSLTVTNLVPTRNVAQDRRRHFEVDPTVHLRWQRDLRGTRHRIVGHYHSHPDGQAEPSPCDRANIVDGDLVWVILSVASGVAGQRPTAWYPVPGEQRFQAVEMVIR